MIKFFRKIRYDLMGKNKTGKYFKYAIGEILLVVIGILVAIQLNEWRNESNNRNQKQDILNALKLEFVSNLQQLDTVFYFLNKVPKAYFLANKMMKTPQNGYSDKDYGDLIVNLSWTYTFNPSNGALRSAISSSEIHLIENKRLIEILFSWEDVIKDSEEEGLTLRKFQYESQSYKGKFISSIHEWEPMLSEMAPPIKISDYKRLLQDEAFENYSILSYAYAEEYMTELKNIKKQNSEILLLIEQELIK